MTLLKWAFIFFLISVVAAIFGFGGVAEGAGDIAQVLFFIFLAICAVLFVVGLAVYKKIT